MDVIAAAPVHDVVIIGSGAAGGMAAWNLTRRGVNVLMLDAGERFVHGRRGPPVPWEWRERVSRGLPPVALYHLNTAEQPYTWAPGRRFALVRVWGRGGKTNIWGRVSLRFSDLDLAGPARDGWEIPWPIRYADLAPYYDRLDRVMGICGGDDDQEALPGSRYHGRSLAPICSEALLGRAARRLNLDVVPCRLAMARRPRGRFFNSSDHLVDRALATGRLTIVDNAVAGRITVCADGRARGVQYFDRYTNAERHVLARVVVVAASCIDSTRILLNSLSPIYPNGIGNSNDVIGRYLTEHIRFHLGGVLPDLVGSPVMNHCVGGGESLYLPRFNHRDGRSRDYLRGFGIQAWGCGPGEDAAFAKQMPGFGIDLKKRIKDRYPAVVSVHPYGEVLPRHENCVRVDATRTDRYGLPLARIDYTTGENERRMIAEMYDVAESILTAAKAEILPFERYRVDPNGSSVHEHGTCRMGTDRRRSAVNGFCQSHEVPNLFVVDGAVFPTATEKNPTFTILALAWRATDYLADALRAGTF